MLYYILAVLKDNKKTYVIKQFLKKLFRFISIFT